MRLRRRSHRFYLKFLYTDGFFQIEICCRLHTVARSGAADKTWTRMGSDWNPWDLVGGVSLRIRAHGTSSRSSPGFDAAASRVCSSSYGTASNRSRTPRCPSVRAPCPAGRGTQHGGCDDSSPAEGRPRTYASFAASSGDGAAARRRAVNRVAIANATAASTSANTKPTCEPAVNALAACCPRAA
jgi:hypothetical protein